MSFFPDGYDSVTAAKLRNGFDICKFFEPRRANLRNQAVLLASKTAISQKLNGIYSVADLLHMVKSIKQRMTVDAHPHKQFMKILISIEDVRGSDLGLSSRKTDRLMVRYSVSEDIDAVKFIEHIGIVILNLCRRTGLVREYSEKNLPGGTILRIGEHIFLHSELHFCKQFMMGVLTISVQTVESLGDYSRTIPTTGNIEYASRQY